jgi:hypothetical protein
MKNLIRAPSGKILRNPNFPSDFTNPNHLRSSQYKNTLRILEDPIKNRKLILVGTLNCSDILAQRTKSIIEKFNPDSVFVQANRNWYDKVNFTGNVNSNSYIHEITKNDLFENVSFSLDPRDIIANMRFFSWLWTLNHLVGLPTKNANPFLPGLETFFSLDYAIKNKKHVIYGDKFFSEKNLTAMQLEKRMNFIDILMRLTFKNNRLAKWRSEYDDEYSQMCIRGFENYSESVDSYKMNLLTKIFQRIVPHQKHILVDKVNEEIFKQIYEDMPGKTLFAVVNQWHMESIETFWRHSTNTEEKGEFINPIGDFDIEQIMEGNLINDYLRQRASKVAKTEPAITTNYITFYHKQTTEPERERHAFFLGWDDPELEHSLYNDENKHVEYLPYKYHSH